MGTEKIVINKMMLSGTDKRTYNITREVGCVSNVILIYCGTLTKFPLVFHHHRSILTHFLQVVNGLVPDGRALMHRGKEEAQQYEKMFGIKIPGSALSDRLAMQV